MGKFGLIGKKLDYSFSKEIHESLGKYKYDLIELDKKNFHDFLVKKNFDAINVTIPYKEEVIPYLDFIDDNAKVIGAVNTIINNKGKLYGYNTDYYGLKIMANGVKGKKVLILGTGATSKTAYKVCKDLGAKKIIFVSRKNRDKNIIGYKEATTKYNDFEVIINTTPVGMYPNVSKSTIDINKFNNLKLVIDVVYNPLNTKLIIDAKIKGVTTYNGLTMLVVQAIASSYYFLRNKNVSIDKFLEKKQNLMFDIYTYIHEKKHNLVLIGMPGVGKTTCGRLLKKDSHKELIDTDKLIEKKVGLSCKEIILNKGEKYFRKIESEVIEELKFKQGVIISTGGGTVMNDKNVLNLRYNGFFVYLEKKLKALPTTKDRPLSDTKEKLKIVYKERIERYRSIADTTIKL